RNTLFWVTGSGHDHSECKSTLDCWCHLDSLFGLLNRHIQTFGFECHEGMIHFDYTEYSIEQLGPFDRKQRLVDHAGALCEHHCQILRGNTVAWIESQRLLIPLLGLRKIAGNVRFDTEPDPLVLWIGTLCGNHHPVLHFRS